LHPFLVRQTISQKDLQNCTQRPGYSAVFELQSGNAEGVPTLILQLSSLTTNQMYVAAQPITKPTISHNNHMLNLLIVKSTTEVLHNGYSLTEVSPEIWAESSELVSDCCTIVFPLSLIFSGRNSSNHSEERFNNFFGSSLTAILFVIFGTT